MSDAITTGIFGTLIVAILIYLVSRVDRLADKVEGQGERLARVETEVHNHTAAVTRIEGKLDEHLRAHPADSA